MAYTSAVYFIDFENGVDTARAAQSITSSTNATPIAITKAAHGLVTGAIVVVASHLVNTNANGTWKITVIDANTFSLDTAVGNGVGGATGTFTPNGGMNKADAWKTVATGATAARIQPGDTVRIMASPDQTSLGVNGTWVTGPCSLAKNVEASTNATPIVVTLTGHGYANGDVVVIKSHVTNTKANGSWIVANQTANTFELKDHNAGNSVGNGVGGTSGSCTKLNNGCVILASEITKNIACPVGYAGGQGTTTTWTPSTNVTSAVITTDMKQGAESQQITIAAAFTTGLAAFLALGSAVNFSAYQQITFWIKQTAGTIGAAGACQIKLCSDTAGVTAVDTFDIPNLGALNNWTAVTVSKGSALGTSIQSIALYVVTDNAAQTFLFDNFVAVTSVASANSLNLNSLIGLNDGRWHPVQSITGKTIFLDHASSSYPSSVWVPTSATATTFKREPIRIPIATASFIVTTKAGSYGLPIVYSGGWDRTSMVSQNGQTYVSNQSGTQIFCVLDTFAYSTFERLNPVKWSKGFSVVNASDGIILGKAGERTELIACTGSMDFTMSRPMRGLGTISFVGCSAPSNFSIGNNLQDSVFDTVEFLGAPAASAAISVTAIVDTLVFRNLMQSTGPITMIGSRVKTLTLDGSNSTAGSSLSNSWISSMTITGHLVAATSGLLLVGTNLTIVNLSTSGNVSGSTLIGYLAGSVPQSHLQSGKIGVTAHDATTLFLTGTRFYSKPIVMLPRFGNVDTDFRAMLRASPATADTGVKNDSGNYSIKISVAAADTDVTVPFYFPLCSIWCTANVPVTFRAALRRSSTLIENRLWLLGGQIAGVPSDIETAMTAAINTWETVVISFTPTVTGRVEVAQKVYATGSGAYDVWIDSLEVRGALTAFSEVDNLIIVPETSTPFVG